MAEKFSTLGMVLSAMPVGEYDRRVVILTENRGKIHCFAHGARKPGNALMAATQPFVFGEFTLYAGRDAFTISSVKVRDYFEDIGSDMTASCYGCYFLEFADYYGRENSDDLEMLKLLYVTMRALRKKAVPSALIRCVFELRIIAVNGEAPEFFECVGCHSEDGLEVFTVSGRGMLCGRCAQNYEKNTVTVSETVLYTLRYIISSPPENLYAFTVSDEVLKCIQSITGQYIRMYIDKNFNSLEVLSLIE